MAAHTRPDSAPKPTHPTLARARTPALAAPHHCPCATSAGADPPAAIVGQVAGAYYGKPGIPARWLGKLHQGDEIEKIAEGLYQAAISRA